MSGESGLVRVCPACGAHQPPERMRCDCGALLFGVDLTRPAAANAAAPEDQQTSPSVIPAQAGIQTALKEVTPLDSRLRGNDEIKFDADKGQPVSTAAPIRCPHEDCGQLNPAGSRVCLYCNRPLDAASGAPAPALLQLPAALRERYRMLDTFKASGAEADILLVERTPREGAAFAPRVAKIYRQGVLPSAEVQARIARIDPSHCVTVFETGISDGRAYEVMEYCAYGSLRERINGQAQPADFIASVISELAGALQAVHAAALVHRDLKPENVLLRSVQPLDLVLTDFSTASVIDATQRFTSMARTLLYAAPEALSGVLDAKADYWALGMMLLEMATGAHPFRGLSDAVILYQLTTRAMDTSEVDDVRLRQLIGGLLLRDPKRRWGAPEVERWLAGDMDLPDSDEPAPGAGFAQSYAVLQERCTTPQQLAVAFARHWQAGLADLANGQLLHWFTEVQKDQNAVRLLLQLRYESNLNPGQQLLRFILHYAPGIPPMWQGRGIELPALLAQASRALQGDAAAADWLHLLQQQRVLDTYAAAGNAQMAELAARWRAAAENFDAAWRDCAALLYSQSQDAPAPPPDASQPPLIARYDDLVYGQNAATLVGTGLNLAPPPAAALHPRLLAAAYDSAWVERLRAKLTRELAVLTAQRPQLAKLGEPAAMTPAQLLACDALLPAARDLVEQQARQQAQLRQQQAQESADLRAALQVNLHEIAIQARRVNFLLPDVSALSLVLTEHASLLARIRAHGDTSEQWQAVRRQALRGEPVARRMRELCERLSERRTANAGWLSQQTAGFGAVWLVATLALRSLGGVVFLLLMTVGIPLWRYLPMSQMVRDLRQLGRGMEPGTPR